jgi:WD40 repeat protein
MAWIEASMEEDIHSVLLINEDTLQHFGELHGHSEEITCLCFSHDNRLLVTGALDSMVIIWNPQELKPIVTLDCRTHFLGPFAPDQAWDAVDGVIQSVALSGSCRKLLVGMAKMCIGFDIIKGTPLYFIGIERVYNFDAIFFCGNDTQVLTASSNGRVHLHSGKKMQRCKTLYFCSTLGPTALSSDQTMIAKACNRGDDDDGRVKIMLVDVASALPCKFLGGHTRNITALTFSPDGNILASGCTDQTLKIWDVVAGTMLFTYNLFHFASNLSFNSLGTRVVGRYLSWIFVFDVERRDMVDGWGPCDAFAVTKSRLILM